MSEKYIIKDGELYHYGVPGMRWGVRKDGPKSSKKPRDVKSATANSSSIKKWAKKGAITLGASAAVAGLLTLGVSAAVDRAAHTVTNGAKIAKNILLDDF